MKSYDIIVKEVLDVVLQIENECGHKIPVIAAGGIYTRDDIARFLNIGAAGVQIASRFVVTEECDASVNFKQAYPRLSQDCSPLSLLFRQARRQAP